MDKFLCIQAFVRVAECHSFSGAARLLGVPPSVVSSRIKQLEGFVHAPLFHRSTRKVVLSEFGQNFLAECAELIAGLENVTDRIRVSHGAPSGVLRIQVLPGFALGHLGSALRDFSVVYPQINLDISVSDKLSSAEDGYDVWLHIFHPRTENLIGRPLFPVRRVFCASPQYLQQRAPPRKPRDLIFHPLGLYSAYPTRDRWIFRRENEVVTLELPAKLRSNSVHLLCDFTLAGGGISCLPTLVCGEHLWSGTLVPVLEEYELLPPLELLALYPPTQRRLPKVRLLVDFVTRRFKDGPPWDRALRPRSGQN